MPTEVMVAVLGASASVVIAALTYVLTARQARLDILRQRKIERYTALLTAISDLGIQGFNPSTAERFATAANSIVLVAPQSVVEALMRFHDETRLSNPDKSLERHDQLLLELVLELRKSLDLPFRDDRVTFRYHLIGGAIDTRNVA
jgi:hypothetical protein